MKQGEQLKIALTLNQMGLFNVRILVKYIFEEMVKLKDDKSNPRYISLDSQFRILCFVAGKMWEL